VGVAAVTGTGASVLEEVHGGEDYVADEPVQIRADDSRIHYPSHQARPGFHSSDPGNAAVRLGSFTPC